MAASAARNGLYTPTIAPTLPADLLASPLVVTPVVHLAVSYRGSPRGRTTTTPTTRRNLPKATAW